MIAALRHLPSYTFGTWTDESLGVYVGWVARADSFSSEMPLHNELRDRVLVFSGEDFPEHGTPDKLRSRGHSLEGGQPIWSISRKKIQHFRSV